MKLMERHPRSAFLLGLSFATICLLGYAIWGARVFWAMFFAVPWGGTLLFLAVTEWLESETRVRRKRARRARLDAHGAGIAVRRSHSG